MGLAPLDPPYAKSALTRSDLDAMVLPSNECDEGGGTMSLSPRVTAPVLFLVIMVGCAPFSKQPMLGPWNGRLAPPIEGVDSQGRPLRLADQRGKVVLLSFWYSQCPPCRALFPHERALAQRFSGQSFVLLGVNADPSKEKGRQMEEKANLTWASWQDGQGGPIARAYDVQAFPTLILIDQSGAIRFRQQGAPPDGLLETKIEELLREGLKASS